MEKIECYYFFYIILFFVGTVSVDVHLVCRTFYYEILFKVACISLTLIFFRPTTLDTLYGIVVVLISWMKGMFYRHIYVYR